MLTSALFPMPGRAPAVPSLVLPVLLLAGCTQTSSELTTGFGLTLADGEISVDPSAVQTRVSGACDAGMVVTGVNEDGSVVCVAQSPAHGAGEGLLLSGTTFSVNPSTIAAWARDAALDSESELTALLDDNYLPASYVPSWSGLDGIPADLADGDDDTQYTAGAGLSLSGNSFSVNTSATQARVTGTCASGLAVRGINADGTVLCGSTSEAGSASNASRSIVSFGATGFRTPQLTLGADGLLLILHHGTKLVHCEDRACRTFTQTDPLGGQEGALTQGEDGLPLIAYRTNAGLSLARCVDARCTSATSKLVDPGTNVGQGIFLTLGDDGLPLISYQDGAHDSAKLARCQDAACSTADIRTFEAGSSINRHSVPLVVGIDGNPIVAYRATSTQELKVAACADAACTSFTTTTMAMVGNASYDGTNVSLALGADGLPVLTYFSSTDNRFYFTHCEVADCTSSTTQLLLSGVTGHYSSVVMGSDGLPLVSHMLVPSKDLALLHCADEACSRFTSFRIDGASGVVGTYTSLALGADGMATIAYRDEDNGTLKLARVALGRGTQRR